MATTAGPAAGQSADSAYFARFATILSLFIIAAFMLNAVLGRAAYSYSLVWPHVHAVVMVAWLALHVVQARLATNGNLAQHRRLGWLGAYLTVAVVGTMSFAGIAAIRGGFLPPFFTEPYFLALTQVGAVVFGGLVFAAITRRTQTDYHRRLMTGSLILLTEPAFGRVLPMPMMVGWGEWAIMVIQLVFVGMIALHDRRTIGRVHPATATVGAIVAMAHVLIEVAAVSPMFQRIASDIAGG